MISIDVFTLVTAFGALLGLLLIAAFIVQLNLSNIRSKLLLALLTIMTIAQLARFSYNEAVFSQDFRWLALPDMVLFVFAPLFWLYIRSSLFKKIQLSKKWGLHLIPFAIHEIIVLCLLLTHSKEEFFAFANTSIGLYLGWVFTAGGIISVWIYSWLGWSDFHHFKEVSNIQESVVSEVNFIRNFLGGVILVSIFWCIIYLFTVTDVLQPNLYVTGSIWTGFTFLSFYVGFVALTKPEIFRVNEAVKNEKYKQFDIDNAEMERLKTLLDLRMKSKKVYLDKKLNKKQLSDLIKVHPPLLSKVLNEGFGMNFFEFVNTYRIQEFITLVQSKEYEHLTTFGIAQEAGFYSRSTFNKAFKQITGSTPSQYFKQ